MKQTFSLSLIVIYFFIGNNAYANNDHYIQKNIHLLFHHNPQIQQRARNNLSRLSPSAIPRLLVMLSHYDPTIRAGVALTFGLMSSQVWMRPIVKPYAPLLISLTKDFDVRVRKSAVWALGKIGFHSIAIEKALIFAMHDKNIDTSATAIKSFTKITSELSVQPLSKLIDALANKQRAPKAAIVLSFLGKQAASAVPALINALDETDLPIPFIIALGNVNTQGSKAIPKLLNFLSDHRNQSVRFNASLALKKIITRLPPSEAHKTIPLLVEILADENLLAVRRNIFVLFRDLKCARILIQLLGKETNRSVGQTYIDALTYIGKEAIADILTVAQENSDHRTKGFAIGILANIGTKANTQLVISTLKRVAIQQPNLQPVVTWTLQRLQKKK